MSIRERWENLEKQILRPEAALAVNAVRDRKAHTHYLC